MPKVVKLESGRRLEVVPSGRARLQENCPLTPDLKDFIDRAIVPALVENYLAEIALAHAGGPVALSKRSTAATRRVRP